MVIYYHSLSPNDQRRQSSSSHHAVHYVKSHQWMIITCQWLQFCLKYYYLCFICAQKINDLWPILYSYLSLMWLVTSPIVTYSKKPKLYLSNSESQVIRPHLISTAMTLSPDLYLDYSYNMTDLWNACSLFSYKFDVIVCFGFRFVCFLDLLEYILINDSFFHIRRSIQVGLKVSVPVCNV